MPARRCATALGTALLFGTGIAGATPPCGCEFVEVEAIYPSNIQGITFPTNVRFPQPMRSAYPNSYPQIVFADVRAVDFSGNVSAPSEPVSFRVEPRKHQDYSAYYAPGCGCQSPRGYPAPLATPTAALVLLGLTRRRRTGRSTLERRR